MSGSATERCGREKGTFHVGKWQSKGLGAGKHRTPGASENQWAPSLEEAWTNHRWMEGKLPTPSHWIRRGNFSRVLLSVFSALHVWRFELKIGFIRCNTWRRMGLLPHFPFVHESEKEFRTVAAEDWGRFVFTAAQGRPSWLPSRLSCWFLSWFDSSFF